VTRVKAGSGLLDLPAHRAARLVALGFLEAADAAYECLADPADAEALHDFRVAIRRFRSWLLAFRPLLARAARRRVRRRLRAIASSTNAARDAEVQIAWIESHYGSLTPRQRVGARWWQRRLADTAGAGEPLAPDVARAYGRLADSLRRALSRYTLVVDLEEAERSDGFARVMAAQVRGHAAELQGRLDTIQDATDRDRLHAARIAGKKLRYLVEPLSGRIEGAAVLVRQTKALQDALGDVHDALIMGDGLADAMLESAAELSRVLVRNALDGDDGVALRRARGQDPRHGLLGLARLLRRHRDEAFARLEEEWLHGRAEPFFTLTEGIAVELEVWTRADLEIERKYLLSALPPRAAEATAREIEQGYLPGRRLVERLRHERGSGSERWLRTVKSGSGVSRLEIEEETSRKVFDTLWPLTWGSRLTKRRFLVADGDVVWEVDEFTDRDLVLAEIELTSPDDEVEIPGWLRPYVVREVTDEDGYSGAALAR